MKNQIYILICSVLVTVLPVGLQAQSPERRAALLELSERLSTEFHQKKAEAIRWAEANNMPVRQEFEDGTVIELMFLDDNGMPMYYTTHNADGATVIKSDKVYPGGGAGLSLTGAGQTLGMWDAGGVRLTHDELVGRVTQKDIPGGLHDHATHVAGTMIASGALVAAKGMSYAANLDAYDWDDDAAEMALAAANDNIRVSQHSYGAISGFRPFNGDWYWYGDISISTEEDYFFGFYHSIVQAWDQIAHNAPQYLIVKSAGNDRGQGPAPGGFHYFWNGTSWEGSTAVRQIDGGPDGFDCIPLRGNAKNILTVGAVTNTGVMSSFSGWGPTDDGRIKPDIVAKGVAVNSSLATADDAYQSWNGTSMSGPMVSGSVGLLLEHQENLHPGDVLLSSTMKALILHTADDLGRPGPDYENGWGMMNTEAAAAVMSANALTPIHIFERTLNDGDQMRMLVKANGTDPLQATIVWTDVPGTPPAISLNPTTLMLVNDLDMRITQLGGSTYEPFILDPANPASNATTGDNFRDNVEVVHIASPVADQLYEITINHKGALTAGSQEFSLVVTGNSEINEVYLAQSLDNASNYGGTWNNTDNEGYGLGAWSLSNGTNGGSSGWFIGNPEAAGISGMGTTAFGLYANPNNNGNFVNADRPFVGPLAVGSTFSFDWGVNWDSDGAGNKGINLYAGGTGGTQIININMGGSAQITINGNPMFNNYGTNPMTINFEYVSVGNLRVYGTGRDGSETYDETLAVADAPDAVRFYASDLAVGDQRQPYFNNLQITPNFSAVPANATARIIGHVQQDNGLLVEDLIIESPHTLNVWPGNNLTVNGSIVNTAGNSSFVLESDNTGTASFIHFSDNVPATVQRFIEGSSNPTVTRYHNISVPLTQASNPTANLFMNAYLMYWNPVANDWQWITNPADILQVNRGYLTWYTGASTTMNFAGNLNNGVFAADVPSNATGQFSLVPNPYPSAIDWDAAGWTKNNLYDAIYVWSRDINNYRGYGNDQSINQGSRYIAAGQAFWVRANDAAAGLSMNNDVRLHNAIPFREGGFESNTLRIKATADGGQDETVIRLREGATNAFDSHADLHKLRGGQEAPQLYSLSTGNEELSVYSLPFATEVVAIPLSFEMGVEGEVIFTISGTESFEPEATLILEDRLTGIYHSLRQTESLVFEHDPVNATNRFYLYLFAPAGLADQLSNNTFRIWQSGDKLYIDQHGFGGQSGQISIFDMLGRNLLNLTTTLDSPTVIDVSAIRGPVVLRIQTADISLTKKVIIN